MCQALSGNAFEINQNLLLLCNTTAQQLYDTVHLYLPKPLKPLLHQPFSHWHKRWELIKVKR